MLTQKQYDTLLSLQNRPTTYELRARFPNGAIVLAGYTNFGKHNMLKMLQKHKDAWLKVLTADDKITFNRNGKAMTMGPIKIEFSGRTRRQALLEGELPFIADAADELKGTL